jgi:hypothetical protein
VRLSRRPACGVRRRMRQQGAATLSWVPSWRSQVAVSPFTHSTFTVAPTLVARGAPKLTTPHLTTESDPQGLTPAESIASGRIKSEDCESVGGSGAPTRPVAMTRRDKRGDCHGPSDRQTAGALRTQTPLCTRNNRRTFRHFGP